MKNFQILLILIIALVIVSFIQKERVGNKQTKKKNTVTPTLILTQTPTSIPTQVPSPTLTLPTLTSVPSLQKDIKNFIYPGSIILKQSQKEMTLQSSDDPSVITNWYKEKITNLNMNAKSFVQTNSNGHVVNKLIGANTEFKVTIEIERNSSSSISSIKVSIK